MQNEGNPCSGKLLNDSPCPNQCIPGHPHCYPHFLQLPMNQETGQVIMPKYALRSWFDAIAPGFGVLYGLN